jgi:GT2 family glycosyltransferase
LAKVAVVILNYNGINYLEQFLPGVCLHSIPYADVWVADNASTDASVAYVKANFPQVKLVVNAENGGFAKGYNDALAHIEADYYVLLNSDVEVTANWIKPVISLMESDATIAACQPKILAYNNKSSFEYAGAAGGFIDHWGYPFCRGRVFDVCEPDQGQYNNVAEVFWATGACMFVNAKLYHSSGGLDNDFFAHMEEIDLCWRLKNMGYKIMACPQSVVYHVGGGTLSALNPRKTFLNFRNNLYLLLKNDKPYTVALHILGRMVLDGIAGLRFLLKGDFAHFTAILKGHFTFYSHIPKFLKKRNELNKKVVNYSHPQMVNQSIVFAFFVKGRKTYNQLVK